MSATPGIAPSTGIMTVTCRTARTPGYGLLPARVALHADAGLGERAFDLAVELDHEIYDCLYLALALALDCRLVTADDAFVAKAGRRFGARVASLRAF